MEEPAEILAEVEAEMELAQAELADEAVEAVDLDDLAQEDDGADADLNYDDEFEAEESGQVEEVELA